MGQQPGPIGQAIDKTDRGRGGPDHKTPQTTIRDSFTGWLAGEAGTGHYTSDAADGQPHLLTQIMNTGA